MLKKTSKLGFIVKNRVLENQVHARETELFYKNQLQKGVSSVKIKFKRVTAGNFLKSGYFVQKLHFYKLSNTPFK